MRIPARRECSGTRGQGGTPANPLKVMWSGDQGPSVKLFSQTPFACFICHTPLLCDAPDENFSPTSVRPDPMTINSLYVILP
jgi:hypothetical protein